MVDIGQRIKDLRTASGLSREDFAGALGEKPSKIQDVESGRQRVNDEFLQKLIARFPVDLNKLFDATGFTGSTHQIDPPIYDKPQHGDFRSANVEYHMIRRMDLSVSAGRGFEPIEGDASESVALPSRWLSDAGINGNLSVLVTVKGDSMAPSIQDGAFVLVHLMEKQVVKPGIYAFNLDGQSFVKRLIPAEADGDGRALAISIISDNPAFPPKVLTGRKLNDLKVVGRVRAILAMI